jgi:voltage-gated sodium channel
MTDNAWPAVPQEGYNGFEDPEVLPEKKNNRSTMAYVGQNIWKDVFGSGELSEGGEPDAKPYWIKTTQADLFFGGWICLNAIVLAFETDLRNESNEDDAVWIFLDSLFNVVFLSELVLRVYAEKLNWYKDPSNLFDFCLVAIGLLDTWILPASGLDSDMRFVTLMRVFRLFRLVRVLRILRLLRFLRELMLLVRGITSAMRAMVWGLLLLTITIFICSLLITRLVGKDCCDEDNTFQEESYDELFGTLPRSAFTLFQFTMEFQPDICRETWDHGPWLTFFFLAYTTFTNITLLNTVASVIVDNILSISQADQEERKAKEEESLKNETMKRVNSVFGKLDKDSNDRLTREDISPDNAATQQLIEMSGVSIEYAMNLFNIMDVDKNGDISREEFEAAIHSANQAVEGKDIIHLQCQVDSVRVSLKSFFQDSSKQNEAVLEALNRLENKQSMLEEKLVGMQESVKQPDASDLDKMSLSFMPKFASAPQHEPPLLQQAEPWRAIYNQPRPDVRLPVAQDAVGSQETSMLPGSLASPQAKQRWDGPGAGNLPAADAGDETLLV